MNVNLYEGHVPVYRSLVLTFIRFFEIPIKQTKIKKLGGLTWLTKPFAYLLTVQTCRKKPFRPLLLLNNSAAAPLACSLEITGLGCSQIRWGRCLPGDSDSQFEGPLFAGGQ